MKLGILFSLSVFSAFATESKPDSFKDALVKRLNYIFKDQNISRADVGVSAYSLTRDELLYEWNANKALSPASAVKLLTAYVALKRLGPDYKYKTEVFRSGEIKDGILKGDLYLKGGGDPALVSERFFLLAAEVARSGLKKIQGKLIVDDTVFDQIRYDKDRVDTKTDRAYNAPIGGLSFNYNTTTLYFRPGPEVGSKVMVYPEPDTGYIRIINQSQTSKKGSAYKLSASRLAESQQTEDAMLVNGSMPEKMDEQKSYFSVTHPEFYAARGFQYFLKQQGIEFEKPNALEAGKVPSPAKKLAELESLPLREIVTLMNKYSNNFIAEALVKTIAKEINGIPGTAEAGLKILTEEATKIGINTAGFKVVSGSGLTLGNKMTASQFTQLMRAAYKNFDIFPELLTSLPIAGIDGTLKSRLKGTEASGNLRGKTGTMTGMSSLVGVVQSKSGEWISFSVLINEENKAAANFRKFQNYMGQALADFNRNLPIPEAPSKLFEDGN